MTRDIRDEMRRSLEPEGLETPIDWRRVDARLFEHVDAHSVAPDDPSVDRVSKRVFVGASVALAAAVLLAVGFGPKDSSLPTSEAVVTPSSEPKVAANLRREGAGEVLVDGTAKDGLVSLGAGDAIEAKGARAVFPRFSGVAWSLEEGTKVVVEKADGGLVVALDRGAVEAEVTPVDHGEAYAVDVDGVRVAVHGTHLRVASADGKLGRHVTVDLSEGVIAIGSRPVRGSTVGTSVSAPAHVEFDTRDLAASMKVDARPTAIRAPYVFPRDVAKAPTPAIAMHVEPKDPPPVAVPRREEVAVAKPEVRSETVKGPKAVLDPAGFFRAEVERCWGEGSPGTGVQVRVESKLEVRVNAALHAELVRFDPPLAPPVQACVSKAVLARTYPRAETIVLPIQLSR
ncbi:MAG: hypothetical protein U0169_11195 [Polyangiaceae bacterium]